MARVKKGVKTAILIVILMALFVMAFVYVIRGDLLHLFLDVNEEGGTEALEIAVHYITILLVCLISLYLLHIFRNALQAMEVSVWSMISGFIECAARVFMSKAVIHWMGSDALFVSEPVAWIGALLSVMIPYLYYSKKLLKTEK